LLYAGKGWVGNVGSLLAFSMGCSLYYFIFYRTKLVPRWISVWGLVFGISGIVSCALVISLHLVRNKSLWLFQCCHKKWFWQYG
jgi:hypothetical protein